MATKPNIRSIRMSDQVMEFINAQVGDNFNAKFEAMVLRCMWELPVKEEQLKKIQADIEAEKQRLEEIERLRKELEQTIGELQRNLIWKLQKLKEM